MWNDGQSLQAQVPTLTPPMENSIENNISNADLVAQADRYAEEVYTVDDDEKLDEFLLVWMYQNRM